MNKKQLGPIIVSIFLVAAGSFVLVLIHDKWQFNNIKVSNPAISKVETATQELDLKSIIHTAEKSVVQIEGQSEQTTVTGSGFLFNEKGDIITNAHVVNDADVIYVRTANGRIYPAAVVGTGESTDIAVIRVPQLAGQKSLNIETKKKAETGDEVISLGSPHGFQNTVTLGIISGTERNFTVDGFEYQNAYQISAQITEGNSGGPLISRESGNVIGINAVGTNDGTLGFSIPIDDVHKQLSTWSNEAKNENLEFGKTEDIDSTENTEQLVEDAEYVADYFLESISMRDYVGAYTLLGSKMQAGVSYSDFRERFIHYVNLEYSDLESKATDDGRVETSLSVTAEKNMPNEKETKQETFTYVFTIGHENDQLKILKISKSSDDGE
ncbi:S1C family serine protease [Lentibacillus juripiscarius]|uniref:S1C family serine protease n=1 Tax=Lentibacillus juripiscarius TaxID=257446 RepID=A0ABW5V7P7_9BACI